MAPEYEEATKRLAPFSDQVLLAKVNADQHRHLGQRFHIGGYPTLLWFPKGSQQPQNFDAGRDAGSILSFVERKTGIRVPYKSVFVPKDFSAADFDAFLNDKTISGLVMFYAPCTEILLHYRVRTL